MLSPSSREFRSWERKHNAPYDCPNCRVAWSAAPETWNCGEEGCQTASCPECETVCFSCNGVRCMEHMRQSAEGPVCAGCARELEQIEADERSAA